MKVYVINESTMENIIDKLNDLFNQLAFEAESSINDEEVKNYAIESMEKVHNLICAITTIQNTQNNVI